MRYPTPRYSFLAFELNALLDRGLSIHVEETHKRIADGTLFDWLEERFRPEPNYLDLSLYEGPERQGMLEIFGSLSNAVDAKRKMGVERNGLALLVAYCIEVMQHPDAYEQ
jgi:hypothetical protein